ncbi:MAG: N-methyl-L-tryptophan oxidase [Gemmatimonadota bacterium]
MQRHDVIVVGVGGMGSAALYHLARRGARVLGLERFEIPHELGSSHGESRIIRLAYAEDPRYVPLLRRAYELWRQLESLAGERLLVTTGGIDAGPEASETVQGSLRSCALHGLPHEQLDPAELRRRFPALRLDSGMIGVYQPEAGFLLPERCVVAHAAAARELGAEIHTGERVRQWQVEDECVVVTTDRRSYRAGRLVLTVGAWTGSLVPSLTDVAVPERQVVIWARPRRPDLFRLGSFPIFNLEAPEGRFYGCPIHDIPGVKIGRYHHRFERVDDLEHVNRAFDAEDEEVLRVGIRRYLPDADGPAIEMKTCLFTNSPDGHFLIDFLPGSRRVAIAAGFSGHGFKFCSVVGEVLAELVLETAAGPDIEMFRLDRPAVRDRLDPL